MIQARLHLAPALGQCHLMVATVLAHGLLILFETSHATSEDLDRAAPA
ncbi:MAG: hypothetical protein KDC98_16970 [Planctomycetes bacterium]|nr:hypothetical protein [Planctomycetota bacterium]